MLLAQWASGSSASRRIHVHCVHLVLHTALIVLICHLQQSLSPYPSSPLTPDSEEGFIMNIREESRSTRVRNRPKPQPAKKTRVNAQRYGSALCEEILLVRMH